MLQTCTFRSRQRLQDRTAACSCWKPRHPTAMMSILVFVKLLSAVLSLSELRACLLFEWTEGLDYILGFIYHNRKSHGNPVTTKAQTRFLQGSFKSIQQAAIMSGPVVSAKGFFVGQGETAFFTCTSISEPKKPC